MTGLLGRRAIAATTVAVERVVLRHLDEQRLALRDDPAAVAAIDRIAGEEAQHHDASVQMMGSPSAPLRALMAVVALLTEAVIWLGMNLQGFRSGFFPLPESGKGKCPRHTRAMGS